MSIVLSRRLTLEERAEVPDGAGGFASAWTALGTHWAHVEAMTGRHEAGEGYPRSRVPYRITLRSAAQASPSRPRAGQRFREGDRLFLIRAVADKSSDARYLICFAEEEVAA